MGRTKRKRIKYFHIDGRLHRVLAINRGADLVAAWDYQDAKTKTYIWSDVQHRMERSFTVSEVSKMLSRHPSRIKEYLLSDTIRTPQLTYSLETRLPGKYMFSESEVIEVFKFFTTVHRGRPRKDGFVTPQALPTLAELRAMMQHDTMVYIKDENEQFIPVWKEQIW